MANKIVAGELYESITGQLFEIGRQLRQPNGYPYDPERLKLHLQDAIEGRFLETEASTILWTLVDDGRSNADIVASIEAKGGKVSDWAKDISARSQEPIPPAGTEYQLVGIRGDEFADDAKRTTRAILAEADRRRYRKPPMRVGLLLRKKFITNEALGYQYVAVFHNPVRDSNGCPYVLALYRLGAGDWLRAWHARDEYQWTREDLFVFLAPQAS
jgi:hypothetical protein